MRKQVLCLAAVLVGAGWSYAQPGPYGGPVAATLFPGGPPGAQPPAPPAYAPGAGGAMTPVNYGGGAYPYGYNYGAANPANFGYYPPSPVNSPYGNGYPCIPPASAQVPMAPVPPEVEAEAGPVGGVASKWGLGSACRQENCWVNVSYALFFLQRGTVPPLVTVGSALDNPAGALGQPGTAVVFGNNNYNYGSGQGVIAEAGMFLDPDHFIAVDARALYMAPQSIHSTTASDPLGNPLIARPIYNTLFNQERRFLTSFPGEESGSTSVELRSLLYGLESNVSLVGRLATNFEIDVLTGFRYLRFDEQLGVNDTVVPIATNNLSFLNPNNFVNPPNFLTDQDQFSTSNSFYGANIGSRLRWHSNWLSLSLFSKVALGTTEERVRIQGNTTLVTPAGNQTASGGILALPSNIGNYRRTVFGVIPETGLTVGVEPIRHVRLTAGYSYLFWNAVARPGAQIDRAVNPGQVPSSVSFGQSNSSPNPLFTFHDQSFSVNILTLGMELYY